MAAIAGVNFSVFTGLNIVLSGQKVLVTV